jgi:hypothetical protein
LIFLEYPSSTVSENAISLSKPALHSDIVGAIRQYVLYGMIVIAPKEGIGFLQDPMAMQSR